MFQDLSDQDLKDHREQKTSSKRKLTRNTFSRSSLSKLLHPRRKTSLRKNSCPGQEEHTKRKLRVSIDDTEEQFEIDDFLNKFCRRYRPHCRPFVYSHCCINRGLQGSRGDISPRLHPFSTLDPDTLPNPCYQSTETIMSLVTSPYGSRASKSKLCVKTVKTRSSELKYLLNAK